MRKQGSNDYVWIIEEGPDWTPAWLYGFWSRDDAKREMKSYRERKGLPPGAYRVVRYRREVK